ncbi:hypothetical protein EON65_00560 [archaeon]|nr:MAG: hypothetical protein EON65_00560 [archaeon]
MKRLTGFAPPYSVYFVCTVLSYVATTVFHYLIVQYVSRRQNAVIIVLSGTLTATVLVSWFRAVMTNPEPSDKENHSYYCFQVKIKRETRYCPDCKKMVFELDHHCYFLNTCVGTKNYSAFLTVVIATAMQMFLHITVCIRFLMGKNCLGHLEERYV